MKRKMNFKRNVLMILLVATIPAQAGWFSNFGERLKNGVINTIQNNISSRANKAADKTTDAVLDTPSKVVEKQSEEGISAKSQNISDEEKNVVTQNIEDKKGSYEVYDFGNFKARVRKIKYGMLRVGEPYKEVKVKLSKGRYLVELIPRGWSQTVSIEQKEWGKNIVFEKYIHNNGLKEMTGKKGGTFFIIKVETEGELQFGIGNNLDGDGQMEYEVLKLAPGELFLVLM